MVRMSSFLYFIFGGSVVLNIILLLYCVFVIKAYNELKGDVE